MGHTFSVKGLEFRRASTWPSCRAASFAVPESPSELLKDRVSTRSMRVSAGHTCGCGTQSALPRKISLGTCRMDLEAKHLRPNQTVDIERLKRRLSKKNMQGFEEEEPRPLPQSYDNLGAMSFSLQTPNSSDLSLYLASFFKTQTHQNHHQTLIKNSLMSMKRKLTPARKERTRVCSFWRAGKKSRAGKSWKSASSGANETGKKNASDFLPCPIRREHGKEKEKASQSQAIVHWKRGVSRQGGDILFSPLRPKNNYLWRK